VPPTPSAQAIKNEFESSLFVAERVYGAHAAFEKRLDRAVLATVQRAPGLPSSHALLDSMLRRDETIDISDILNGAWRGWGRIGGGRRAPGATSKAQSCRVCVPHSHPPFPGPPPSHYHPQSPRRGPTCPG
jgi:Arc/MetJ family transcription regulator